eukprot:1156162-Pelagomonas_calceolata.AAC.3
MIWVRSKRNLCLKLFTEPASLGDLLYAIDVPPGLNATSNSQALYQACTVICPCVQPASIYKRCFMQLMLLLG